MNRFLSILFLSFVSIALNAKVTVEASIDSIQIFVGQQAHVTLKVTSAFKDKLELPPFKPNTEVLPNVELLEISKPDTSEFDGNRVVSQVYTFTSFDAKVYYLPPLPVKVNGKEYKTESLALKVLTIDVDTTKLDQFFPPKDVQNNPFSWSDWKPVIIVGICLLILIAAFIWIRKRYKANKPIIRTSRIVKKIPAHQKALKELEELKQDAPELTEQAADESSKVYYTRLTDTLRRYIEERYGFNAMEMTSTEIIQKLKENSDEESLRELNELFQTADLVKFAKHNDMMNEKDMNLLNAIEFVNTTKQDIQPSTEGVKPELSEQDQRSLSQRRIMKIVLGVVMVASVASLAFIVYKLYDLLF